MRLRITCVSHWIRVALVVNRLLSMNGQTVMKANAVSSFTVFASVSNPTSNVLCCKCWSIRRHETYSNYWLIHWRMKSIITLADISHFHNNYQTWNVIELFRSEHKGTTQTGTLYILRHANDMKRFCVTFSARAFANMIASLYCIMEHNGENGQRHEHRTLSTQNQMLATIDHHHNISIQYMHPKLEPQLCHTLDRTEITQFAFVECAHIFGFVGRRNIAHPN